MYESVGEVFSLPKVIPPLDMSLKLIVAIISIYYLIGINAVVVHYLYDYKLVDSYISTVTTESSSCKYLINKFKHEYT